MPNRVLCKYLVINEYYTYLDIQYLLLKIWSYHNFILLQISDVSNSEPNSDFGEIPELDYLMETNESLVNGLEIHKWSCHVYYMLLSHLPAMVSTFKNQSFPIPPEWSCDRLEDFRCLLYAQHVKRKQSINITNLFLVSDYKKGGKKPSLQKNPFENQLQ